MHPRLGGARVGTNGEKGQIDWQKCQGAVIPGLTWDPWLLQQAVAELQAAAQHRGSIEHHICDVRIAQGLPGSVVSMLVTRVWTGSAYVLPSVMAKTR